MLQNTVCNNQIWKLNKTMLMFHSSQSSDSPDSGDLAAHQLKLGTKVCYDFFLSVYISVLNATGKESLEFNSLCFEEPLD